MRISVRPWKAALMRQNAIQKNPTTRAQRGRSMDWEIRLGGVRERRTRKTSSTAAIVTKAEAMTSKTT